MAAQCKGRLVEVVERGTWRERKGLNQTGKGGWEEPARGGRFNQLWARVGRRQSWRA